MDIVFLVYSSQQEKLLCNCFCWREMFLLQALTLNESDFNEAPLFILFCEGFCSDTILTTIVTRILLHFSFVMMDFDLLPRAFHPIN